MQALLRLATLHIATVLFVCNTVDIRVTLSVNFHQLRERPYWRSSFEMSGPGIFFGLKLASELTGYTLKAYHFYHKGVIFLFL